MTSYIYKKIIMRFTGITLALLCTVLFAHAQKTVTVKDPGELRKAVKDASPGDVIALAAGEWKDADLIVQGNGTAQKPIMVMPEKPGSVVITGTSVLKIGGGHLHVKGLHFKNGSAPGKEVIVFRIDSKTLANYCRISEIVIESYSPDDNTKNDNWVALHGKNNRVDHCTFVNKLNLGPTLVVVLNDERSTENFHSIDSNYFKGRARQEVNGGETIRVGVSQHAHTSSKTSIKHNYFEHCNGEAEIVSVKSGENQISFNTFFESEGSLVLRHGNNNVVEGNLFIGNNKKQTGGVRVINAGHQVFNNVFKDIAGDGPRAALAVMNGVPNSPANRYHQVNNVDIHHNTFLNCKRVEFGLGKNDELTLAPKNVQFRDNLILFANETFYKNNNEGNGITFSNNLLVKSTARNFPKGFKSVSASVQNIGKLELPQQIDNAGASVSTLDFIGREAVGATWYTATGAKTGKTNNSSPALRLSEMFSDNMVLQRDKPIVVWGWAAPHSFVSVELDHEVVKATVSADGKWAITLPAKPAGGPFTLSVANNGEVIKTYKNVLMGDVWLLSGQSNMGWKVSQSKDAENELSNATFPAIRLITIGRAMANVPQEQLKPAAWEACTPSTASGFSGIGFFFGRELHNDLKVPIGLVHASWGGTNIEAWMSRETLDTLPKFKPALDSLPLIDLNARIAAGTSERKQWLDEIEKQDIGKKEQWQKAETISGWSNIHLPAVWEETKLGEIDGIIWVSKTIELTKAEANDKSEISLGRIDNEDITYVNGTEVGFSTNKDLVRTYTVAPGILKEGTNRITVRTKDTGSIGGFRSSPDKLYIKTKTRTIALAGQWSYALGTPTLRAIPTEVHPNGYPTVLYNAMLHPLLNYQMKGVLWYQGESNASRAHEYRTLFPAMISGWRKITGDEVSFLFVQLANYKEEKTAPQKTDWAELREAQALALHLPNTGMAVAIDVGEADNIHPKNKQEVARRLALLAKQKSYGMQGVAGSPLYERMEKTASGIRIYFKNEGSALKTADGSLSLRGFAIAGEDKKFVWAEATLDPQNKNAVIVHHNKIPNPVAVRYAWADNPGKLNVVNAEGLPASPFRTDSWRQQEGKASMINEK